MLYGISLFLCNENIISVQNGMRGMLELRVTLLVSKSLRFDATERSFVQAKSLESSMQELLSSVAQTLQAGGNVFIPCDPTGLLLDLMDHLHSFFVGNNIDNVSNTSICRDIGVAYIAWVCQFQHAPPFYILCILSGVLSEFLTVCQSRKSAWSRAVRRMWCRMPISFQSG